MSEVYALRCTVNGKVYVGCTSSGTAKRLREHRCLLRAETHKEPDLQADWKQYGEPAFVMESLESVSDELAERRAAETKWMDHFRSAGLLYNRNLASFAPKDGVQALSKRRTGMKNSPESNLKRRLAQLGKPKNHGHKISATKRAKQLMR